MSVSIIKKTMLVGSQGSKTEMLMPMFTGMVCMSGSGYFLPKLLMWKLEYQPRERITNLKKEL